MVDNPQAPEEDAAVTSRWRYCLHIAYYGTGFVGWQRQQQAAISASGHDSVQEVVELAVTSVLEAPKRINVTGVSRTDAGTHALYQYGFIRLASELQMTLEEFKGQVNAKLGNGRIIVLGVMRPTTGPSKIRSRCKKYIYYLQQGHRPDLELGKYSWFLGRTLNIQRLRDALKNVDFSLDPHISGTGDIIDATDLYHKDATSKPITEEHNLDNSKDVASSEHKKRKVESNGGVQVHFVCIELVANGFLRHMVRRIIGTLRPIGEGTQPPSRIQQVLAGEVAPGPSAPTKALWLHRTWLTQEDYDADCAVEE
ncbi:hypothetical protein BBJ29_002114 [Phytophthora kernoviae]|uniref:tRNA pseudouridine synthase n=1 Tax=Phytophthora kernoviae TaxID=325452 RepID=A0A3F2RZQ6_9STRA|nr:hypothetical protein BBJ29_002114 [Phytophthora kernoviae]RLN66550.1 hypothetical protein BBP00_00002162 [Phytophthora kernoviae]